MNTHTKSSIEIRTSKNQATSRFGIPRRSLLLAVTLGLLCIPSGRGFGASATWTGTVDNDWTNDSNWSAAHPNGSPDIATFATSGNTTPTVLGGVSPNAIDVDSVVFNAGASNFNIAVTGGTTGANYAQFTFNGAGVVNNSTATQQFTVSGLNFRGYMYFVNSSSAGSNVVYTVDSGGVLELGGTSSGGTATFIINSGGVMGVYNSSTANGASITNNSGGVLDLTAHDAGTVTIGGVGGGGDIYLAGHNLSLGGDNLDATISGIIHDGFYASGSGSGGSLTKTGTGTLVITAANDYTGGTTINAGVLKLGDGSTSNASVGTGDVTVNSGGTFILDLQQNAIFANNIIDNQLVIVDDMPSANYSVSGIISGTGALIKTGANTVTLTGSNSYTGGTTVNAGVLLSGGAFAFVNNTPYVVNSGTLGLNSFDLTMSSLSGTGGTVSLGSAALTVNQTGATRYDGAITGSGSLVKSGAGTLALGGANTYTGDTTINGGLLQVDGSTASANTIVNAGGILGGIGTIGGNVSNGGIVSPGDSPGTLTISGNYTQTSAGTLVIQIAGLGAGQHDLLAVGGIASLDGKLQLVRLNNFIVHAGDTLTFLTATGGVSGKFATVDTGTILDAKIVYQPNDVLLKFTQGSFAGFASHAGLTPNQMAVANNLDIVATDPRVTALINFLNNESRGNLPPDFDLISPEELTAIFDIAFSYADVQMSNIETHLAGVRDEGTTQEVTVANVSFQDGKSAVSLRKDDDKKSVSAPESSSKWNVFMEGSGDFVRVSGDLNAPGYDFTTGGVTIGADYRVCDHFTAGIMGGYANTGATLTQNGSVDVNAGKVGIYSTVYDHGFYLNAIAAGGYNSYDTHRAGLGGIAQGSTDGEEFDGLIGTGYELHRGHFTFGPIASLQYTYVAINGFNEAGTLAPLNIPSQNQDSLRSQVGFKISSDWKVQGVTVTPTLTGAWQHEYMDTSYALDSSFANGAGSVFTVHGPALGRDAAVVKAGFNVQWTPRFGTYIYYDGELGRKNYQLNAVSGGARVSF